MIVYRIAEGASDKFVISSSSGIISVAQGSKLDPDLTDPKTTEYSLTVVSFHL
jgi:cadherin 23